ncbi:unnamed protein product [Amoebophrya sp. A120]|nr:unnamed protein product [Amoebophrya sp. A120]|eukprot:GSA120T00015390001.1
MIFSHLASPAFSYWSVHCASGALAVALGAFGAHGLKGRGLDTRMLEVWDTGVRYQFVHSLLGLFAVMHRHVEVKSGSTHPASHNYGSLLAGIGNLLFAGSLYGIVLTDIKKLGIITPIGGLLYIAAWLCVAADL